MLSYFERLPQTTYLSPRLKGLAPLDKTRQDSQSRQHSTMRAARYYGKEDVRIEHDVAAPPEQLLEGQVRVQPAFVGICGTG